jgi:hypothetical protein
VLVVVQMPMVLAATAAAKTFHCFFMTNPPGVMFLIPCATPSRGGREQCRPQATFHELGKIPSRRLHQRQAPRLRTLA